MAGSTILHIGDDLCRRILVMETAGFVVFQSEVTIPAIHIAFTRKEDYSAVVFHNDIAAVPEDAVHEARSLSEAPLVLFQNPTVASNEAEFELVIPSLTSPDVWLLRLRDVIEASQESRNRSLQLRRDCKAIRSKSHDLRSTSARSLVPSLDSDAPWRGSGADELPDSKPPQDVRPAKFGEKAG